MTFITILTDYCVCREMASFARALLRGSRGLPLARPFVVRATGTASSQQEGFIARNEKLGRPMSPSLGILAQNPDLVWVLSFGHRASGFVLTGGISAAAITYLVKDTPLPEAIKGLEGFVSAHPYLWMDCKFMMALPLTYHFFNGIRHLNWDTGRGFDMKSVYRNGYMVLSLAILSALGLAIYTPGK